MSAQGRAAGLAPRLHQAAPRRAFPKKLPQGGQHPNRRRSGMAWTPLLRWRAEIDNRRDEVQEPEIQYFLPCLTRQTWSFQINNAPHRCCITAIPSNPSARDPTTHGISGNCLLGAQRQGDHACRHAISPVIPGRPCSTTGGLDDPVLGASGRFSLPWIAVKWRIPAPKSSSILARPWSA